MKILGISAYYHDSAAALTVDGEIIAAAQEERFTRQKHTAVFPANAVKYCLCEAGLGLDELDAVVFYDKPFLKFERLIETYYTFAPRGLISFIKAMPVWMKEKLLLKSILRKELRQIENYNKKKLKLLFTEHHLSHAASAYFASPFSSAAILTVDGVGEWCTASLGFGSAGNIRFLRQLNFPHSPGLLYSAFTYYLGFAVNSGEYKLMGLAPYGNRHSAQVNDFRQRIEDKLVSIKQDGSLWMDQNYFDYAAGLRMARDSEWEKLFGFSRRDTSEAIEQHHCNLALAAQMVIEDIVLKMAFELKKLTGSENLCMAGGVALNCVANARLRDAGLFRNIFVQPAAGDAGGSLGAALAAHYIYFGKQFNPRTKDAMKGTYLGPAFTNEETKQTLTEMGAVFTYFEDVDELCGIVAGRLAGGAIVGWCNGRMEFGPRALGNRSILADPRNSAMQKKLNLSIKYREGFRPFAPVVCAENASDYFEMATESPYMLFTCQLKEPLKEPLPPDFEKLTWSEKLAVNKSRLPAITHQDFSARVQTVSEETNPPFHKLLKTFGSLTGVPLLVNTSFNVRGEPPVCTPAEAFECFMQTEMDLLVVNNFLLYKTEQPEHANKHRWKREFKKD